MIALRYYRLKLGLTQATLGHAAGVDKGYICHIERGRLKPSERMLTRLAAALGVTPAFTLLRPIEDIHEQLVFKDEQVSA